MSVWYKWFIVSVIVVLGILIGPFALIGESWAMVWFVLCGPVAVFAEQCMGGLSISTIGMNATISLLWAMIVGGIVTLGARAIASLLCKKKDSTDSP
jgi:hypothetical protein